MDNDLKTYIDSLEPHTEMTDQEADTIYNNISQYRNRIIEGNLRLVVKVVIEIHRAWGNFDIMDLIQEGNVGLINAVDKFEVDKGIKFSTFASFVIRNDVLRFIKNNSSMVNIYKTDNQRKVLNNLSKIKTKLEANGLQHVADEFDVPPEFIETAVNSNREVSVYDLDHAEEPSLVDPGPEARMIKNEIQERLLNKITRFREKLDDRELVIFDENLYDGDKSLQDIATFFDISRERARQIKERVLEKARKHFSREDLTDLIHG